MKRTFPAFGKQSPHNRSFASTRHKYSMLFGSIGGLVLALIFCSCSSIPHTQRVTPSEEENSLNLRYSMVFFIHGDGNYRYHDTDGHAYKADDKALAGAIGVAEQNPQAEVFIFHQKPGRRTLFFFPRPDGEVYYYRQGRLFAKETYWRDSGQSRFDPEIALYHRFRANEQSSVARMFLYFGHEIPEYDGTGYDASYPKENFTVHDLADGLERITPDTTKFDIIVLSTCFGGTPHTIGALSPFTSTIVASPDNLHLSYLNLSPFERLDVSLSDGDAAGFAKSFASRAFDRLTEELQTAVTVAVYDVDRVQEYLHAVDSVYNHTLTKLKGQKPVFVEYYDCADDSAYVLPGMSEGVEIFYRPPQFGRFKHKQNHSGWECPGLRN